MSIRIIKKFSGKCESAGSVAARLRARNRARAEALAKARAAAKKRNEDDGDQVGDITMDADTAEVLFSDKDANLQVLVGEDPVDGGIVVAVATAEKDNVEEEEVLASITVGEGEGEGAPEATEESKKKRAVEEARAAIMARLKK